jgi:hypothetical protein
LDGHSAKCNGFRKACSVSRHLHSRPNARVVPFLRPRGTDAFAARPDDTLAAARPHTLHGSLGWIRSTRTSSVIIPPRVPPTDFQLSVEPRLASVTTLPHPRARELRVVPAESTVCAPHPSLQSSGSLRMVLCEHLHFAVHGHQPPACCISPNFPGFPRSPKAH